LTVKMCTVSIFGLRIGALLLSMLSNCGAKLVCACFMIETNKPKAKVSFFFFLSYDL